MLFRVFLQSLLLGVSVNSVSCRTYYLSPGNSQLLDSSRSDNAARVRDRRSMTFVDKDYKPLPKVSQAFWQQYDTRALAQSATEPKALQYVLRPFPAIHPSWNVQATLAAFSRGLLRTMIDNTEIINEFRSWFHIALILLKWSPWIIIAKIILLPALALAATIAVATPVERKKRSTDSTLTSLDALDFPFEFDGKTWMDQLKQVVTDNQNQARSATDGEIDEKPYPTRFNCCLHPDYRNLVQAKGGHGVVRCTPEGKKVSCFNKLVYLIDVGGKVSKPVKVEQPYVWW